MKRRSSEKRGCPKCGKASERVGTTDVWHCRSCGYAASEKPQKSFDQYGTKIGTPKDWQPPLPAPTVPTHDPRLGDDFVYETSAWTRELFYDEVTRKGELAGAYAKRGDEGAPESRSWGTLVRELFGRLYGYGTTRKPDEELPPDVEWAKRLHETADSYPEWITALHECRGDEWLSGLTAAEVSKRLEKTLPELPPDHKALDQEREQLEQQTPAEQGGQIPAAELEKLRADHAARQKAADDIRAEFAQLPDHVLRETVGAAVEQGTQAAQEIAELGGTLAGYGTGVASRKEVRDVLMNDKVRDVARMAGRVHEAISRARPTKTVRGNEELVGVTLSGEIERLVPSELQAFVADDAYAASAFTRLIESNAMSYEMVGEDKLDRGPIIIAIDESGSMGASDFVSKSFALGLMKLAFDEKRPFAVIHFDSIVTRVDRYDSPSSVTVGRLKDTITHFTGGGTSIASSVRKAVELIGDGGTLQKADLVIITDADDVREDDASYQALTNTGARTFGVVVTDSYAASASNPRWAWFADFTEELVVMQRKQFEAGELKPFGEMFARIGRTLET